MEDLKYIVVEGFLGEEIYVFPPFVVHKDCFKKIGGKLISAGFVDKDWNCYGESVSLNVKSRKEDTELLTTWQYKI